MLDSHQRRHLKRLAHGLKPVVFIGQSGVSPTVVRAFQEALQRHELIKLKFNEFKEKENKSEIVTALVEKTGAEAVGMVGHTAIFFLAHPDPEKRRIKLPSK
jgi:RNA-binding protein